MGGIVGEAIAIATVFAAIFLAACCIAIAVAFPGVGIIALVLCWAAFRAVRARLYPEKRRSK